MTEAWLRGPVQGVPAELMPAAHAVIDASEEIRAAMEGLTPAQLWLKPGGAASLGFHARHVAGSLDRLLTYARGEGLSDAQRVALAAEREPGEPPASASDVTKAFDEAVARTLEVYGSTDPSTLDEPRAVGQAKLPSNVRGLLFHAAEHARRHAGQAIATSKIVRGLGLNGEG